VSLPTRASVVVVGGGVMGTSIAFHLAEAGVGDVLLLEQAQLGSGSTCKAAGGVRAQFSDPINIALGLRGLDAFERFPDRPGQEIDLRQPGYLFLLSSEQEVAAYEQSVALQNAMGVPSRMLTPAEAVELSPAIDTDGLLAASYHHRDGYCSPESVVLGYATGARRHGATIRTGVQVLGIDTEGGEITAVETDAGTVATSAVICAAGAWSRDVGALAGVDLPVEPLRRQILISEPLPPDLLGLLPESMAMTIDAGTTFYFHREGPGLLLGMSYQDETPGFRLDYSEAWLPDLMAAIERRAPALLDLGIAHRWVGLYEVTPDHNALLGESSTVSRFLYATGFSGHGFLQGPAVGEVVRDLYLGRQPFLDVAPFSAERFGSGELRGEVNIV
jgi:glycine/D-amino acid oxidase-like deaminating enzyme